MARSCSPRGNGLKVTLQCRVDFDNILDQVQVADSLGQELETEVVFVIEFPRESGARVKLSTPEEIAQFALSYWKQEKDENRRRRRRLKDQAKKERKLSSLSAV